MFNDQNALKEILETKCIDAKRTKIEQYINSIRSTSVRKEKLLKEVRLMNTQMRLDKFIVNIYLVGEGLKVVS